MKQIILATLIFLVTIQSQLFGQNSCAPSATYHFTQNANDASGNGINGTVYNATLTTDREGNANSAYSFDGSTSYIDLGNNALLQRYATDFTISAWVYLNQYSTSYGSGVVSNRDANDIGSGLVIGGALSNQGKVCLVVQGGGSASSVVSNTTLALNTWYFIAATYTYSGGNANSATIYVNGIAETTGNISNVIQPTTTHTYIGFEPSPLAPAAYHFNGTIDEVNIYNCALTNQQVYNSYYPCGPVATYHFTGNANDVSGNNINGTVYNATLTADRNGIANSAYSFDGSTSYIDLGNNALLQLYATDFTISAWVYLNQYSTSYGSGVVSNRDANDIGSGLVIGGALSNQGKVCLVVQGGGSASTVVSNTTLALNTWYFIAATYTYKGGNVNSATIYVNGVPENTGIISDVIQPTTTHTYIGFEPSSLAPIQYHFDGVIDEVNLYNCALTAQEIVDTYNPCTPVAIYHFTDNANDASGNGLNGTVYNATLTADRNGAANSAYSFDGSTSYIDLGNNALLQRYATNFTISAWVYLNQYSSSYGSGVVSNRDANNIGSGLSIGGALSNQGKVCLVIQGGGNSSTVISNTTLALNTWYFIAATYTYSGGNVNSATIYVNGLPETTGTLSDVVQPTTTHTYIGFEPSPLAPAAYHFDGMIDEVNIYNCALTNQQIADSYTPVVTSVTTATQKSLLPTSETISIYPNPGNGFFNITNAPLNASYQLYTITGNNVTNDSLNSTIDLSSMQKGIYLLKIIDQNGTAVSKKLVIE